jgi:hypothetical protein
MPVPGGHFWEIVGLLGMPGDSRGLDLVGAFLEEEEACRATRAQVRERLPVSEIYVRFCCLGRPVQETYLPPTVLFDLLGPAVFLQFFQQVSIWRKGWYLGSAFRLWAWAVARRQVGKWRVATNVRSTTA